MISIGMKFNSEDELYEAAKILDDKEYEYEPAGDNTLIVYKECIAKEELEKELKTIWSPKKIDSTVAEVQTVENLSDEERKNFYRNRFIGIPVRRE